MKKKLEVNAYNEKELKKFLQYAVLGTRLGRIKYPKDYFLQANMFACMYSEIRDIANYLFFFFLKLRLLEDKVIKQLQEVKGIKSLKQGDISEDGWIKKDNKWVKLDKKGNIIKKWRRN